jgi:hypothetical protein
MPTSYPIITTVGQQPETVCRELPERVFDYPFFNVGVTACGPGRSISMESLEFKEQGGELALAGLLFNVSHCGSTLLCQQLNQLEAVRVVSETEAINGLLLSKVLYGLADEAVIHQLQRMVQLYRQPAGSQRKLVIKLTSWNIFLLPLFLRAFPGVPWIFLDRDTEDLLPSLLRSDGGFIDWWDHPVDITRKQFLGAATPASKKDYLKAMVAGHREQANRYRDRRALFLQYPAFLHEFDRILMHFNITAGAEELARARGVLRYDAKSMEPVEWRANR